MGTPDFAVPSLRRLIGDGHEVAAVYTRQDKPQGRHFVLTPPPVKLLAQQSGLPVLQPGTLREAQVWAALSALAPEVIVVAAYGRILPKEILEIPKRGCINVHGSLLPKYRGAAPIQRAVLNGETETGVTIMQMDEGLDTGGILLSKSVAIGPDETAGQLFERMAQLGAEALSETLFSLDSLAVVKQDETLATWAPPLTRQDGLLDWTQDVSAVYARLRGVTPRPGAHTLLGGRILKVHAGVPCGMSGRPGELLDSGRLIVGCKTGSLLLTSVQLEGARALSGEEFLRGQRLRPGCRLGQS